MFNFKNSKKMENLLELNLVELNAQEIHETEGRDTVYFGAYLFNKIKNSANGVINYLSNLDHSGGNTPYTDGSYMFW